MHKFVRKLVTEWRRLKLPMENATIVVAVSGGADSLSLLLALEELFLTKKIGIRLVAAHFNHRLRGKDSDADEEFVRTLTIDRKIELAIGHQAAHVETGNVEQNARVARHEFLRKTAENIAAVAVLTAHTLNDQAETVLMNLIRGSGQDGLGGIRPIRELSREAFVTEPTDRTDGPQGESLLPFDLFPVLLVRPLLSWARRQDTEEYCHDREVNFRYDNMNEDLNFTRVRIRKLLLPMLEEFNPKIIETLSNTALLMQKSVDSEQNLSIMTIPDELSLQELVKLEKPDLYRNLRAWLRGKRGNLRRLELKHIKAIERLAQSRKSGRLVELPGGTAVIKSGGKLVYKDLKVEKWPPDN